MSRGDFAAYKSQILKNLHDGVDFSPKGSIDTPILELVHLINSHRSYITTSSCSGRLSVSYHLDSQNKKGVNWLLIKHGIIVKDEVLTALEGLSKLEVIPKLVYLKCEALILHICCESLGAAKDFHALAMQCGYRESGISISFTNKVMLAIRTSSFSLDMPLAIDGELLLNSSNLNVIIDEANGILLNNFARTDKLLLAIKDTLCPLTLSYFNPSPPDRADISQLLHRTSSKAIQVTLNGHSLLFCTGGKQTLTKPLPILTAYPLLTSHPDHKSRPPKATKPSPITVFASSAANSTRGLSADVYTVRHEGEVPTGRWGHVWTVLFSSPLCCGAFMSGGRDLDQIFSDSYLATITLLEDRDDQGRPVVLCVWRLLDVVYCDGHGSSVNGGPWGLQRFHHAASMVNTHIHDESHFQEVCVYGGLSSLDDTLPLPDGHVIYILINAYTYTCTARLVHTLAPLCGHSMV
ncbi:hypothetical protein EON64_03815, partial [archaeon]